MMPEGSAMEIAGRARVLPDLVSTDHIISSRRKRDVADPRQLVGYIFEDLDPPLVEPLQKGDIIVAGQGFGCGSAMEIAVYVLVSAGIGCILARSFSRTYYRNAVSVGLPVLEILEGQVTEGDQLKLVFGMKPTVTNETRGTVLECAPLSGFAVGVVRSGGLIEHHRAHGILPRGRL